MEVNIRRVFERTVILFFLRKTIPLQWGYEILLEVKNRFFFFFKRDYMIHKHKNQVYDETSYSTVKKGKTTILK